jgi:S1-C subfamily serine protease
VSFTDLLVVLLVAAAAVYGAARGLVVQLLSFVGLAVGALVGSRIAPHLIAGGSSSAWVPVAGLIGAIVGAVLLQTISVALGRPLFRAVAVGPARAVDAAGGAIFGAAVGLALAWLFAVVALQQPSLGLRRDVQRSEILPRLLGAIPPDDVLNALGRFDPLPLLGGLPGTRLPAPDPSVRETPGARAAQAAVVKVVGTSCGLGVSGSGWIVEPNLVATNVHVVTGERDTRVLTSGGGDLPATIVYADSRNDVALLRVPGLTTAPLAAAPETEEPRSVALLGYPGDGPLVAEPGTAGPTRQILGRDAYGEGPLLREVVPLRGPVRRGDSGGPAVDRRGRVVAMMFAAARGERGGFGVPVDVVEDAAAGRLRPVAPGPCAG